ncbi:sugar ABC transporter ATP-binding protein [Conexibacter woesei]|uniref:sugar ABC transporter ATP-binding protein n=1 Tax=Conexibacter woesei TaxID=191495 RepID=UPI000410BB14|nr:sugar ABC transporter ATP-binding protein [Conexibacter woesei]
MLVSGVRPASATDPTLGTGTERPVALRADNLAKSFGATKALRSCSFELRAGEVHCIVGENGSGKSTLVKILSGIHRPDSGQLDLPDSDAAKLTSPAQAARAGIATVFQEVLVVEPRSVLENVWMGVDGVLRTAVAIDEKRARAGAILERLLGTAPDLDRPVEHLTLSERQACCLARALVREPRVLILDEATSALDIETRNRLFALLRERTAAGTSVIFISHRMDEIADIGDRCTVMRSGDTVATLQRHEATASELVRLMTGADHLAAEAAERTHVAPGPVVLEVEGFTLRAGELVGLAGLEGHGQDAFLRALAASAGARAAYVPRERRAESLFESKSIRENFGIVTLGRDARRGLLSPARTRARLSEYVDRLRIKLGDPEDAITTLSGGNQQKVVMARWLATEPEVLLLNDPTRGVDINAKRDLYDLLLDLAAGGMAIVMLSTEVDEHVELMDRVVVFREGKVAAELPRAALTRQALVAAFFGEAVDA